MGKSSGGGASESQSELARQQAEIAKDVYERTKGLRGGVIAGAERRLGMPITQTVQIGTNPDGTPIFGPSPESPVALFGPQAPEREALELGFRGARENIISRSPVRGGQLNNQLFNLDVERARSLGAQEAAATQQATGFATGAAFNAPAVAITGLNQAGGQFGQIAQQQQAQQASKDQSTGAAVAKAAML